MGVAHPTRTQHKPQTNMKNAQKKKILKHLERGWGITPITALQKYGCFRLAARIKDLRDEGYNIKTVPSKDGKQFATYKLSKA